MSIVKINAITVPADRAEEFERRFAARAGTVSSSPGFEAFELMRPADGRETYLVYTRWESEAAYQGWRDGAEFNRAHPHGGAAGGGHPGGHPGGPSEGAPAPVSTQSELWEFEVIQSESAPSA